MTWSNLASACVFRTVDGMRELAGAGVVQVSGQQCRQLRDSRHASGLATFVVLDALDTAQPPPAVHARQLLSRLTAVGLRCGAAGLVGVISLAAAKRASGRVEVTFPVAHGNAAAFLTTDAARAPMPRSAARLAVAHHERADLDSATWHGAASTALEAVARFESAHFDAPLVRGVLEVHQLTGRSFEDVLSRMFDHEKRQLAHELARLRVPGVSPKKLAASLRLGARGRLYRNHAIAPTLRAELVDRLAMGLNAERVALAARVPALAVYLYQEE